MPKKIYKKKCPPYSQPSDHEEVIKSSTKTYARNRRYEIKEEWENFVDENNTFNEEKEEADINFTIDRINGLASWNHPLGTLHRVPADELIFDLRGLTIRQAEYYLHCLIFELDSDPRRVSGEIRCELRVGHDYLDKYNPIRTEFIKNFQHVSVSSEEDVLILTIRKKSVYADSIDWSTVL
ncbi:hypothetical protein B9Z55_021004 [Caenorhabditis nigoni]|uniref:Uncharacterized protein n=1 Tax=Caenorhabditis nigoni TaxID=1611254 RepID=A0A2G5TQ39_9PELO|nr:hypothetical protein B9Z55_021004 [Caenorhabditis nigoni]